MLEIKNLTKNYCQINVVNNICLTIEDGDIMGFIGRNVPRYILKV